MANFGPKVAQILVNFRLLWKTRLLGKVKNALATFGNSWINLCFLIPTSGHTGRRGGGKNVFEA